MPKRAGGDPGPAPGRRTFLRFAAAAGGASLLSACSGKGSAPAAGGTTTPASPNSTGGAAMSARAAAAAAAGPPTAADWAALARDLSGPLIRPGEAGYTTARELFDPRFDSLHPAGVAYCRNPHDVATSLAFVRRYGIPVAARCGGHSYAGWSSTSGLIVDVTRMAGVHVSGGTATVGAGTLLIDFYNGLRRARPRRARRLLPDGRHLRPDPGRRHRRGRPGLRADLRQRDVHADRHR